MISKTDAMRFAIGYETIKVAYRATQEGLSQRKLNSQAIVRERWRLPPGQEPSKEQAHDGWSDHDQFWEDVGAVEWDSENAVESIREAFVIALFHFWERSANGWCVVNSYDEEKTFAELKAIGRQPDEGRLRVLRLLANCLKHGPSSKPAGACNQLYSECPHLFLETPDTRSKQRPPSNEHLQISNELVDELFQAVRQSGPPATSFNDEWELLA